MNEDHESEQESEVPNKRSRRRLIGGLTAAVLVVGGTGGGLLAASGSTTTAGTTLTGTGPHGAFPGGTPPAAVGTVESVNKTGDTFTLKGRSGTTVTVDATSSTTYSDPSVSSATFANIKVGEQVAVAGTTSSGTVTASNVMVGIGAFPGGSGGSGGTPPAAVGTVESVNKTGDTFTLKGSSGTTVTVDATSSTTYSDPSVSSATFANITVGEQVAVVGSTSSGTVSATKVMTGTRAFPGGPGHAPPSGTSSTTG